MQEHEKIPYDSLAFQEYWGEGLRLPGQSKGLDRWFFQWQWRNSPIIDDEQDSDRPIVTESGYYASYVIGAQWFDEAKTMPLVITTKHGCDRIDFLKMFSVCFNSGIEAKEFSKIYAVDMEQPRIKAPELKSVLSPLIVAHFLSIVKEIVKRGLKKDYVQREGNLNKVKGRIDISRNERMNIMKKRYDKVFCRYQEYSEDYSLSISCRMKEFLKAFFLCSIPYMSVWQPLVELKMKLRFGKSKRLSIIRYSRNTMMPSNLRR